VATAETPHGVAEANQSAPKTMKKYDWSIPVRDFFRTAKKHGLEPIAVNNGDGWVSTSTLALAAAEITATDESHVRLTHTDGSRVTAYIVLGNEPAELVADYTIHPALDAATDEHYNNWEGKPCPTTTTEQ
jgi:hypothetical protein